MQISSKAWHLRLMRALEDDYKPKNLCQHFWTVAAAMLFVAMFSPFWAAIRVSLSIGAKLPTLKHKREKKPPGLIRSYIKARKQHYCPLIEVVED